MKDKNVEISVIMSVYNTSKEYLDIAVNSIINQTFCNFEFIIINDGSSEECSNNILHYKDPRIRLIINERNIGLTKSLNKGLKLAQGKYIARMDADDYSYPQRLELQYNYLESHPEIDILGCWVKEGKKTKKSCGCVTSDWRYARMLFDNVGIYHPTAFIKTKFLKDHGLLYNEKILKAQDFELWTRCLEFGRMYVLPRVLLYYRIHEQQISKCMLEEQQCYNYAIREQLLSKLNLELEEAERQQFIYINVPALSAMQFEQFIQKIIKANDNYLIFNQDILRYELNTKWIIHMIKAPGKRKKDYFSPQYGYHWLNFKYYIYMIIVALRKYDLLKRHREKLVNE